MTIALVGSVLVVLTALGGWLADGVAGLIPAALAGLLGLGLHALAAAWIRRALHGEFKHLAGAMAGGMGIRLLGAAIVVGAVMYDETVFLPGPTLFGYVAVLVPLLFMEIRLLR